MKQGDNLFINRYSKIRWTNLRLCDFLQWQYPDSTAAGRYRCQVKGLGPLGQPVEQADEVVVEEHR